MYVCTLYGIKKNTYRKEKSKRRWSDVSRELRSTFVQDFCDWSKVSRSSRIEEWLILRRSFTCIYNR